jgi:hypothetical protein
VLFTKKGGAIMTVVKYGRCEGCGKEAYLQVIDTGVYKHKKCGNVQYKVVKSGLNREVKEILAQSEYIRSINV